MPLGNRFHWWGSAEKELQELVRGSVERLHLKLNEVPHKIVKRKNPYLYRLRGIATPTEFATAIIDAAVSSSEETMFGSLFEEAAIIICRHAKGGTKSSAEGIDLEYDSVEGARVLVQIKSGRNWGNSSQQKALRSNFERATRILKQGAKRTPVECIEGICYGGNERKFVHNHERVVGKAFWTEILGWEHADEALMELIGGHVGQDWQRTRDASIEGVVDYLNRESVAEQGEINWIALLRLISSPTRREIGIHLKNHSQAG